MSADLVHQSSTPIGADATTSSVLADSIAEERETTTMSVESMIGPCHAQQADHTISGLVKGYPLRKTDYNAFVALRMSKAAQLMRRATDIRKAAASLAAATRRFDDELTRRRVDVDPPYP